MMRDPTATEPTVPTTGQTPPAGPLQAPAANTAPTGQREPQAIAPVQAPAAPVAPAGPLQAPAANTAPTGQAPATGAPISLANNPAPAVTAASTGQAPATGAPTPMARNPAPGAPAATTAPTGQNPTPGVPAANVAPTAQQEPPAAIVAPAATMAPAATPTSAAYRSRRCPEGDMKWRWATKRRRWSPHRLQHRSKIQLSNPSRQGRFPPAAAHVQSPLHEQHVWPRSNITSARCSGSS